MLAAQCFELYTWGDHDIYQGCLKLLIKAESYYGFCFLPLGRNPFAAIDARNDINVLELLDICIGSPVKQLKIKMSRTLFNLSDGKLFRNTTVFLLLSGFHGLLLFYTSDN